MAVLLIGTLDTKGSEYQFVRDLLRTAGLETLVLDAGVLNPPLFQADIGRDQVYAAAGTSLAAVQKSADRGQAIEAAARGASQIALDLSKQGKVDGILAMGGSAGTTIATAAMRALPFGIPKLMVSTLASGQVRPYVGVRDIVMMHSVVDISGLNRISRLVLTNAANAMIGMIRGQESGIRSQDSGLGQESVKPEALASMIESGQEILITREGQAVARLAKAEKPLVTATMFGVTTPCVEASRRIMEENGYEVLVFHATGSGGMTMESFIADGIIAGVLDITTTELADELVGGVLSAGRDRLTAAGLRGVPQVISLGALDMVNFGPAETVPEKFRGRRLYQHNPSVTLMRTTPEENDRLGREIAEKASAARGPTAILVPLRGVSAIDREGQPFWWPQADSALFQSLRHWLSPHVRLIELDVHINDPAFAKTACETLLAMLRRS
jgi:uncharacterized protein (UPF0261 family)